MNPFQSNSAPFILALIVSALGWYVGEINSDIRNTKVATYRLDAEANAPRAVVTIENVSRTESLEDIVFALECGGDVDERQSGNNRGGIVKFPPIAPIKGIVDRTAGRIAVTASLAPGGAIGLRAALADCRGPLVFYYKPKGNDHFLLLSGSSLRGWMAKNYIDALPILFFVLAILFLAWLGLNVFYWWRRRNETPLADNFHNVRLWAAGPVEPGSAADTAPDDHDRPNRRGRRQSARKTGE